MSFIKAPSARERAEWNNAGKDVVVLHMFPRGKTCPNLSPHPLKLETFLRMAEVEYKTEFKRFMSKKGKCPWITMNGKDVADSNLSIQHITEVTGKDMDAHLSEQERAVALAMSRTLNEHFHWIMALDRLVFNKGKYFPVMSNGFGIPKFLEPLLIKFYIAPHVVRDAKSQGIGRHSEEEIKKMALEDLKAFSDYLGTKPFLMGDTPSTVDCSLFAFLCMVTYCVPEDNFMRVAIGEKHVNLKYYADRMKARYWKDWDEVLGNKEDIKEDKEDIKEDKDPEEDRGDEQNETVLTTA